jgi:hypothetical protein
MVFAGQMAVHAAEQVGWFACGTSIESQQDTESPGTSHVPFSGCCQQAMTLIGTSEWISPAESSEIQYPPFSNMRPDGPVFEIEIPPQVG